MSISKRFRDVLTQFETTLSPVKMSKHGTLTSLRAKPVCEECFLEKDFVTTDELGVPKKLCAVHAKEFGSYTKQRVCVDCPTKKKLALRIQMNTEI